MSQVARQLQEREFSRKQRTQETQQVSIPKRKRITKGEKVLWTLGLVIIFSLAAIMISKEASIFTVNRDVNGLQNDLTLIGKQNQQLQVEVTKLSRPERITNYAEEKLGLKVDSNNVKMIK